MTGSSILRSFSFFQRKSSNHTFILRFFGILLLLYCVYLFCLVNFLPFTSSKPYSPPNNGTSKPLILIWNLLQNHHSDWLQQTPLTPTQTKNFLANKNSISPPMCSSSCAITFDRNLLDSADAVLISLYDSHVCLYLNSFVAGILDFLTFGRLTESLCWFPYSDFGEGKDVFLYFLEPPGMLFYHMNKWRVLEYLQTRVDYTISYRRDSTIFTPYIIPSLKVHYNPMSNNPSIRNLSPGDKVPVRIIWMVSNCHAASRREEYVYELQEYVEVLIIGKCEKDICSLKTHSERDCMESLIAQGYTYYISFENELCSEYVTEKLGKTMDVDIVPIIMTGSLDAISDVIPPVSAYIDSQDFKNPKDLTRHLLSMTKEDWMAHMEWKKVGSLPGYADYVNTSIYGHEPHFMCQICQFMSLGKEFKQSFSIRNSLLSWWQNQTCLPPYM